MVGGLIAAENGLDTVDMLTLESPVTPLLENLWACGLAANDINEGATIIIPPTAQDFAPFVAQLSSGPAAGSQYFVPPVVIVPLGAAFSQSGIENLIMTANGTINAENLEQSGGADTPYEGTITFGPFPGPDNPVWADYYAAFESSAPTCSAR